MFWSLFHGHRANRINALSGFLSPDSRGPRESKGFSLFLLDANSSGPSADPASVINAESSRTRESENIYTTSWYRDTVFFDFQDTGSGTYRGRAIPSGLSALAR